MLCAPGEAIEKSWSAGVGSISSWGVMVILVKDSADKAERPWLCGRGRSSLFSIYLTWLQYAANYHRVFDCPWMIARQRSVVKRYVRRVLVYQHRQAGEN